MRISFVLAMCLSMLPATGQATQVCSMTGPALAAQVEGQWQLNVVSAKLITESSERDLTPGAPEPVQLTLAEDGNGTMQIKAAALDLRAHPAGTVEISTMGAHNAAFMSAMDTLGASAQLPLQDCGLISLPHFSAKRNADGAKDGPRNVVELVLLDNGLMAGAQVVQVTGAMLGQSTAPDMTIISSIVLRRAPDKVAE